MRKSSPSSQSRQLLIRTSHCTSAIQIYLIYPIRISFRAGTLRLFQHSDHMLPHSLLSPCSSKSLQGFFFTLNIAASSYIIILNLGDLRTMKSEIRQPLRRTIVPYVELYRQN